MMNGRGRSHGHETFFIAILRPQLDLVEDAEDGRLGALAGVEAEITDAPCHDQPDVRILELTLRNAFFDHPSHGFFRHGNLEPDRFRRCVQSAEVFLQSEYAATVGADALEYAIAIEEAVVEYRNDRGTAVVPLPIYPNE